MKYTPWQLDALRSALNNYRTSRRQESAFLSWETVSAHLQVSPTSVNSYGANSQESSFRGESLRRFALGMAEPKEAKLDDIKSFLVARGFLKDEDFDPARREYPEIHSFCKYFAQGARFQSATVYRGVWTEAEYSVSAELQLFPETVRGNAYLPFRAEERLHFTVRDIGGTGQNQKEIQRVRVRRGYGCQASGSGVMHIFLEGESGDRVTYLELPPDDLFANDVLFVRVGGDGGDPTHSIHDLEGASRSVNSAVRRFLGDDPVIDILSRNDEISSKRNAENSGDQNAA